MQLPWVSSFYAPFYVYVFLFVARDAVASNLTEEAALLQLEPQPVPLEALQPVPQTIWEPAVPGQFLYPGTFWPQLQPQFAQFAQLSPSWENKRGDRQAWTGPYGQLHRFAGQGDQKNNMSKRNMSFPPINRPQSLQFGIHELALVAGVKSVVRAQSLHNWHDSALL